VHAAELESSAREPQWCDTSAGIAICTCQGHRCRTLVVLPISCPLTVDHVLDALTGAATGGDHERLTRAPWPGAKCNAIFADTDHDQRLIMMIFQHRPPARLPGRVDAAIIHLECEDDEGAAALGHRGRIRAAWATWIGSRGHGSTCRCLSAPPRPVRLRRASASSGMTARGLRLIRLAISIWPNPTARRGCSAGRSDERLGTAACRPAPPSARAQRPRTRRHRWPVQLRLEPTRRARS